ncbi:MAG: hydrogenase expression/formation protein [Aquificae bacterium]|nr:hydrogenase expression/formation protein [Aquificota bacterium]
MLMNAVPILNEIYENLKEFYKTGKRHTIFTNKIPLCEEDKKFLKEALGEGNIKIEIKSELHPAIWKETKINGVWIGIIYDKNQNPIVETIEITDFPQLAKSQREDILNSIKTLENTLKNFIPPR